MHSEITESQQPLVPSEVHLALTSGLAPGAKLRENRIFTLSATGVEFKGEPTLAQWMDRPDRRASSQRCAAQGVHFGRRHRQAR